jgi:hypothetical protein
MSRAARWQGGLLVVVLFVGVLGGPAVSRAETPLPDPPKLEMDTPVSHGFNTAAAAIGTVFFAPFKALLLCPASALASGVTYAATAGAKQPAEYVLQLGCTGTYAITPGMLEGRESFHAIDEYPK